MFRSHGFGYLSEKRCLFFIIQASNSFKTFTIFLYVIVKIAFYLGHHCIPKYIFMVARI